MAKIKEPRIGWTVQQCVDWVIDNNILISEGYVIHTVDDVRNLMCDLENVFEVYLEYSDNELLFILDKLRSR